MVSGKCLCIIPHVSYFETWNTKCISISSLFFGTLASIWLRQLLCPLWSVLIFWHHPSISFPSLLSCKLLSSLGLRGSKQLSKADQILPDSEKCPSVCINEDAKTCKGQLKGLGRIMWGLHCQNNSRTWWNADIKKESGDTQETSKRPQKLK